MSEWPKISIVTSSFNQGKFIAATVESVLTQNYPNLEHIIMDGGSTDDTLEVLKRYPHLKVVSERDKGQADAINKGFKLATGEIFGFLNSDDTFLPGTLHRVAEELKPSQGRHMVMGRCLFIDEQGNYGGIQHPSRYESHIRVLKIWKGYMLPQPAIFWSREVWERLGTLDLSLKYHLDYDLFCKMTQEYDIYCVDQVFATYRLHSESKTEQWSEADRLEDSVRISRRYWGSPISLKYWILTLSLAWFKLNRVGRSRKSYYEGREFWRHGQIVNAIGKVAWAALLAPEVAFLMGLYPKFKDSIKASFNRFYVWSINRGSTAEKTKVFLDRTTVWNDGWAGPRLKLKRSILSDADVIIIRGEVDASYLPEPLSLSILIDDCAIGTIRPEGNGFFVRELSIPSTVGRGVHCIEIRSNTYWVHHHYAQSGDFRPLSWRLHPQDSVVVAGADTTRMFVEHHTNQARSGVIIMTDGWHQVEQDGLSWVRWVGGIGGMEFITNYGGKCTVRGDLYTLLPGNRAIWRLNGKEIGALDLRCDGFNPIMDLSFKVEPGHHKLSLVSERGVFVSESDPRSLGVAVRNVFVEIQRT